MAYDVETMKAPLATGFLLRLLARLAESPLTGGLLSSKLLEDAGLTLVREVPTEDVLPVRPALPETSGVDFQRCEPGARCPWPGEGTEASSAGFHFTTVADYQRAYQEGSRTPSDVAEAMLETVGRWDAQQIPMRLFIAQDADDVRAQAQASAARWQAGQPLGPLDGVPVAVKDEMDQAGYPTTLGTAFLGQDSVPEDAEPVARMRCLVDSSLTLPSAPVTLILFLPVMRPCP